MEDFVQIYFKDRNEFRKWLSVNHNKQKGLWMIFYKKHTKIQCISYDESVEEAICCGWIDSTLKKLDEQRYIQKFTPRTNSKNWSDLNKIRALKMIEEGKMTEHGLNKIDADLHTRENKEKVNYNLEIPDSFIFELSQNQPALENFEKLSKTTKKQYIYWIFSAKREETIEKRIKETIFLLKNNIKLGLK